MSNLKPQYYGQLIHINSTGFKRSKLLNKPKEDLSNKLYTIKEAAKFLKVDKQTVRNHIERGTLNATNFGRSIRIPHYEFFDALDEIKSLKYKR